MMNTKRIIIIALLAAALISIFVLRPIAASVSTYSQQIKSIDERKNKVLMLTAASSATSAAITLLPADVGTPIADQLAEFSKAFLVILTVLYAEKYLLPIFGLIGTMLLAVACALGAIYISWPRYYRIKRLAVKSLILALALTLLVPASLWISDIVEGAFHSTIEVSVDSAISSEEEIVKAGEENTINGGKNIFQKIGDSIGDAVDSITSGAANALESAKTALSKFSETIAILLVVDCAIPILVLFAFVMIVKHVFGLSYTTGNVANLVLPKNKLGKKPTAEKQKIKENEKFDH